MTGIILPGNQEDIFTAGSAADPGTGVEFLKQSSAFFGHMGHGQVLQFQHLAGLRGIGDFEHELSAHFILQPEVLVPFAGQPVGRGGNVEKLLGQRGRLSFIEPGGMSHQIGHGFFSFCMLPENKSIFQRVRRIY